MYNSQQYTFFNKVSQMCYSAITFSLWGVSGIIEVLIGGINDEHKRIRAL